MRALLLFLLPLVSSSTIDSSNRRHLEDSNSSTFECPLTGFLQFTSSGKDLLNVELSPQSSINVPFTHLAAALLAVDHFNARDTAVVPQLGDFEDCRVQIPSLDFHDTTGRVTTVAAQLTQEAVDPPCAIVGPYTSGATVEAGVVAGGMKIPVISHGADDTRLTLQNYPTVMNTAMNLHPMGEAVINFLRSKGRTDFLAGVYVTAEFGLSFQQTINNAAKEANFTRIMSTTIAKPYTGFEPNSAVRYALDAIKKKTYRTVFVALNTIGYALELLADAAEEYGMNNGDYVWVIATPREVKLGEYPHFIGKSSNANVTKLLNGATIIQIMDGFDYNVALGKKDLFLESWKAQDSNFVDRVNALNPIRKNRPGYFFAQSDFFQTHLPEAGAGYMYDAVITAGLGKCMELEAADKAAAAAAANINPNGNKTNRRRRRNLIKGERSIVPEMHRRAQKKKEPSIPQIEGIKNVVFNGATGRIKFNEGKHSRNRVRDTVTWGAYNIRPISEDDASLNRNLTHWVYLTDILQGGPVHGTWTETADGPIVFANGSPDPPKLLRNIPDQNYLTDGVKILGIVLMSVSIFFSCFFAIFVLKYQEKTIIKSAQPIFLYLLLFGTVMIAVSILTLSFDEGSGWSDSALDRACLAFPWLLSLGYITIYCALFMKLWRINKVLQARRRTVKATHVVAPFVAMELAAVAILSLWTAIDPFTWHRHIIDEDSGESYGKCESDNDIAFVSVLIAIMATSTILTAYMAWKTKDIDEKYSESSWIFYTIVLQIQVMIVGIPILIILENESANATYLGRILLIWTISMSTLLVIFGPKVIKSVFTKSTRTSMRTRGSGTGTTRVSGVSLPTQSYTSQLHSITNQSEPMRDSISQSGVITSLASSGFEDSTFLQNLSIEETSEELETNQDIDEELLAESGDLTSLRKVEEDNENEMEDTENISQEETIDSTTNESRMNVRVNG